MARHLNTEELLLYVETELDDAALCRHVQECVDCKASLVELQETFVSATVAIRATVRPEPVEWQAASLSTLRQRMAGEAEQLVNHLNPEELLLSTEDELARDRVEHLEACAACRNARARTSTLLSDIEHELRALLPDEPLERKAAALAALEVRLQTETVAIEAAGIENADKKPAKVIAFPAQQVRRYAGYAAAAAAAFMIWGGLQPEQSPRPEPIAAIAELSPPAGAPVPAIGSVPATEPSSQDSSAGVVPVRSTLIPSAQPAPFEFAAASLREPVAQTIDFGSSPGLSTLASFRKNAVAPQFARVLDVSLPAPPQFALPAAAALVVKEVDSPDAVVDGALLLAQAGLWKQNLRAGGDAETIRISGQVDSTETLAALQKKVATIADGRSVAFDVAVRHVELDSGSGRFLERASNGPSGGLVRNSLLAHYRDAARRSFQSPRSSLLEAELDRYVSEVLRHDTELLAHVHAIHSVVSRLGSTVAEANPNLKKLVDYHVNGIRDREAAIYGRLSEVLPRRYWAYRSDMATESTGDLKTRSDQLLADALGLDAGLSALFVSGNSSLDASGDERSSGEHLARIRSHIAGFRKALR